MDRENSNWAGVDCARAKSRVVQGSEEQNWRNCLRAMVVRKRGDIAAMSEPELSLPRESRLSNKLVIWCGLLLIAGIPRIIAAVLLPNEEGDPYSYLRAIEMMRDSILNGSFTLAELFGFWLPLYQFVSALLSTLFGNPLYVAKLVSAVSGAAVCVFVFAISRELT